MAVLETREVKENAEMEPTAVVLQETEKVKDSASPRGVLEISIVGTDSDNSTSSCELTPRRPSSREGYGLQWKTMIGSINKKSVRRFFVVPLLTNYDQTKKNLLKKLAKIQNSEDESSVIGIPVAKPSWRNFEYAELSAATNNFSSENMIGKGGHAEVYRGCLPDGQVVAIKKLINDEKDEEDRVSDFLSELGIIAHINHPNAAHLIGFSTENGLYLVLQFLPHGSLATLLFGSEECVEWDIRFKIALGVAEGLQYLHRGCHRRIIHRDIKASNILLNENFDAQISDFGLAKWLPENWSHHVVFPIEGTFGYLAPEYFMHGIVDEKTDAFAYGVLLLELITGRRAVDSCRQSLVIWAKPLLDSNNVKELADPRLGDSYDPVEMKRVMLAASMCINHFSTMRPDMSQVVLALRGEDGVVELKPRLSTRRTVVLDGCDLQDYTCTSYLNDLNRHMQLAME